MSDPQVPIWAQPIQGADVTTGVREGIRFRLLLSHTPGKDDWPFTLHIFRLREKRRGGRDAGQWREEIWVPLRGGNLTDLQEAIEKALATLDPLERLTV